MKRTFSKITIVLLLFVSVNSFSQSYSFIPGKVYSTNLDTGQIGLLGGITIVNTGTTSLDFSWDLVYKSVLPDCSFMMCNNGECLGELPLTGTMSSIPASTNGFLKFHLSPGKTMGTNIFKYLLSSGSQKDTLTYIITIGNPSGIFETSKSNDVASVYPIPANDNFTIESKVQNSVIDLLDISGKVVLRSELIYGSNKLNCEKLNIGVYFYKISEGGSIISSGKFVVSH